jgi:hypothetical protein
MNPHELAVKKYEGRLGALSWKQNHSTIVLKASRRTMMVRRSPQHRRRVGRSSLGQASGQLWPRQFWVNDPVDVRFAGYGSGSSLACVHPVTGVGPWQLGSAQGALQG